MSYGEQYEAEMWDAIASQEDDGPVHTWLVKLPVVDRQGVIVEWRPKMVIPKTSEREALRIARAEYGPKADIWIYGSGL